MNSKETREKPAKREKRKVPVGKRRIDTAHT